MIGCVRIRESDRKAGFADWATLLGKIILQIIVQSGEGFHKSINEEFRERLAVGRKLGGVYIRLIVFSPTLQTVPARRPVVLRAKVYCCLKRVCVTNLDERVSPLQ